MRSKEPRNLASEDDDRRLEARRQKLESSSKELAERQKRAEGTSQRFMTARVLSFTALVVFFFVTASTGREIWAWAGMIPSLILFIAFVIRHGPVKRKIARLERLARLVSDQQARLDSEPRPPLAETTLAETPRGVLHDRDGARDHWAMPTHVLEDLAVFEGRAHLYSLVDTAPSRLGRMVLAEWMRHPSLDPEEIRSRQEAARRLAAEELMREKLEQGFAEIRDCPSPDDLAFVEDHPMDPGEDPGFGKLLLLAGLSFGGLLIGSLLNLLWLFVIGLVAAALGNRIFRVGLSRTPEIRDGLTRFLAPASVFEDAASRIEDLEAEAPALLVDIAARLRAFGAEDEAGESWARQKKRLGWLGLYRAGLVYVFFNQVSFYDLFFIFPLARFFRDRRERALEAYRALGELEALVSLANLSIEQKGYRWPKILDGKQPKIVIAKGRHPYLSSASAIGNSISLAPDQPLMVITGSNMAGKSTYLKMVGLSLLCAQVGGPVRADEAELTPLCLSSDINVQDSLDDGQSYFAVEVSRIKEMLDLVAEHPMALLLLDEMFRGTNTHEKVAAGIEVTRHLAASGALSLVATHDHEFTELESGEPELGIRNFHFSENLNEGVMEFHYHLESGPAVSRNAIRVLESRGFPRDLVERALERSLRHE